MKRYIRSSKRLDKIDQLLKQIRNKAHEVMQSPQFGFPPEDIDEYLFLEFVGSSNPDGGFLEVRAELSYDGMVRLSEQLDPIIQKFDKDSYFEMEAPGIMTAYIDYANL